VFGPLSIFAVKRGEVPVLGQPAPMLTGGAVARAGLLGQAMLACFGELRSGSVSPCVAVLPQKPLLAWLEFRLGLLLKPPENLLLRLVEAIMVVRAPRHLREARKLHQVARLGRLQAGERASVAAAEELLQHAAAQATLSFGPLPREWGFSAQPLPIPHDDVVGQARVAVQRLLS